MEKLRPDQATATEDRAQLRRRLLWFVGLWAAGVLALTAVAGLFRLLLHVQ